MTADTLRRAADLMRERAGAATPGPWSVWDGWGPTSDGLMGFSRLGPPSGERILHHDDMRDIHAKRADIEHIATMHPTLAVHMAEWLDEVAGWLDEGLGVINVRTNWPDMWEGMTSSALTVARAYLGESE